MAKASKHPVETYISGVARGKIHASKWVKLAVQRYLRDLKHGHERGLWFDRAAAIHKIEFFKFLRHSKGEWAGKMFTLAPWEQFIVWCVFGWKRKDGHRRFRVAYVEVPKKNGKSTFAAGIGLNLFYADNEPGAEVYSVATKRDQARITHSEAVRMVRQSPDLRGEIAIFRDNMNIPMTASKFEPLGRDSDGAEGINTHGAVVDELHAHKNREMFDIIEGSTGARRQPLIFIITTAGWDRNSICWEQREYVTKILAGIISDDTYFGYIACADEEDDWRKVSTWRKANPNLGVTVKMDDLRRLAKKAMRLPSAQNAFRRYRLNEWTEQAERWLDLSVWDACAHAVDITQLKRLACYGGLDLSSTRDITAFELVFPPQIDDLWHFLSFFWVPRETIITRSKDDRVPYDTWRKQGLIKATDGNVVDYDVVRDDINALADKYHIREIAYDTWNSSQLVTQLTGDGATMVPFRQGFFSMSPPTKEFEKMLLRKVVAHRGNPVLRWMASNVALNRDPADNVKPDKKKSSERIDGIVAAIMAVGRAMVHNKEDFSSAYEEHGIRMI